MIGSGEAGDLTFTVAVLSHKRPHLLSRVLWAVSQLDYPAFEVVVVGDQPDLSTYDVPDFIARQVKYVHCAQANICLSRNLAIAEAGGEVVAFCDDDAVPEPDWLTQLARAFRIPDVGGVGGLVRGSDGLHVEWRGGVFDRAAVEQPLQMRDDFRVFDGESQVYGNEFIGTMGANSAFRREAVLSVGGFDESFRYYLDETDMMLRLAEAGWDSAVALGAEVHHLREANATRDALRTPRNLQEIAASKAYFCRRHMMDGDIDGCLKAFLKARINELDPYILAGLVRRRDRARLIGQLDSGLKEGLARMPNLPIREALAEPGFNAFSAPCPVPLSIAIVTGWNPFATRRLRLAASELAEAGHRVSAFSFHSGRRKRTVCYADGVWQHRGGTWRLDKGRDRNALISRRARAQDEMARVNSRRSFDVTLSCGALPGATARKVLLRGASWPVYVAVHDGARPGAIDLDQAMAAIEVALEVVGSGIDPATSSVVRSQTGLDAGRNSNGVA